MCLKKKNKKEEIEVPDNAREFYQSNVQFVFNYEKERENSVLEQAGRLLVVESIIAAGYCQIISTYISTNAATKYDGSFLAKICILSGLLLVLSIIVTIFAQHRFFRRGAPDLQEIKEHISKNCVDFTSEQLNFDYIDAFVVDMYKSLKKLNNFRCVFLTIAMVLIIAIIIAVILAGAAWMLGV